MKIKLYRLSLTRYLLAFFFFLSISFKAQNAFLISFPVDPPPSLTTCFGSSKLTVQLDATIASTTGGDVTIQLATGVNYVPGSVALVSTIGGLSIAENGGTANAPKFIVSPATLSPGNRIVFTIDRTATCATRTHALASGIFKDTVTASIGASSDTKASSSYQINYPVLTFTQPAAQNNAVVGTTYTRTFNIKNGGNGCLSQLYLSLDNPSSGIQQISLQVTKHGTTSITPITITPSSTSGTTTYYTVPSSALPGGDLCTNEDITITETYKVLKCNGVTNYSAGWGCDPAPANWCETKTGSGSISMAVGVPNFNQFTVAKVGYVNDCTPFSLTFTYKNNGTGNVSAATLYNTIFRVGGGSVVPMSNFRFDVLNLGNATINGNPVPHTGGTASGIYTMTVKDLFTTDPDGAGVGLADTDGDGYFDDLPAGASVVFSVQANVNCSAFSCVNSGAVSQYDGLQGDVQYTTMCSSTVVTPTKVLDSHWNSDQNTVLSTYFGLISQLSQTAYAPANITGGTPFRMRFSVGVYRVDPVNFNPNQRFVYEITLPAGLTVSGTGNPQWVNGADVNSTAYIPVTYTQSGSVVTVVSPSTTFGMVYLDLVYTCGAGGPITVPYKLKYINDYAAGCSCNSDWFCGSYTIANALCPTPCPLGGPSVTSFKVERANNSLGWTNNTLTTHQLRSAISAYDLSKALPLDDIDITANAVQNTVSSNNLYVKLAIKRFGANAGVRLTPNSIDVVIKRGGSTVASGTVTTFATTGTTTTKEFTIWNLTSILPSGGILANDVVETVSHYTVSGKYNDYPNVDTQTGDTFYFYNLDTSNNELACNSVVPEMYLVGFSNEYFRGSVSQVTSCNSNLNYIYTANRFGAAGAKYKNEIRPGFQVQTLRVTVPTGYTMDNVYHTNNSQVSSTTALVPSSVVGNVYTYDIAPVGEDINIVNIYNSIYNVSLKPTCATPSTTSDLGIYFYGQKYYYHYKDIGVPNPDLGVLLDSPTETITYNTTTRPAITLTNQTGSIQASKATESFTVRMSSTGTTTAPYTWLAVPTLAGVNVTQIVDVATNTPLTLIPYSGGVWAKLSTTGLASGTSKDYRIDFTYTTCSSTTFQAIAGWNCSGYPSDPIAYACTASKADLTFVPQPAVVQINTIAEPVSPINLCTVLNYEFQVNSVAAGNLINNKFNITLPAGLTITPGSLLVEYPAGAGNWQAVTTTTSGYTTTLDLTAHSNYPAQGIPGTLNDGGNANNRLIGIKFNATTDCSFTSGSYVIVSTDANKTCGQPATGSGSLLNTSTLTVSGADPGYVLSPTITNPTTPITDCVSPITMHIKRVVVLSTASGTPSTATLRVNYPQGYTITNTTPNCYATTTFCPTFLNTGTDPVSGLGYAVYSIPAGMQTTDFLEFDITFTPTGSLSNGNYSTTITTDDVINGLSCPSAPGGVCTSVRVRTSTATYNFTLQCYCYKPAVTSGTALDTNHGITALGRAGADNSNWPMVRKGAWTALEAKTKGFVINRLTDAQISAISSADLVKGMMVYNISQDCLQINIDGTAAGWKCFNTQTCPDY